MATTTASISISSSDMIPGMAMNYYKTATLHKAGGCKGLEKIQSGTREYTSTSTVELLDESVVTTDKANKLYIKNLSTPKEAQINPYKPHIIYSNRLNFSEPSFNLLSIFS